MYIILKGYHALNGTHDLDDLFSCDDVTSLCTLDPYKQCVHKSAICDGILDCTSHADESNCSYTRMCTQPEQHVCVAVTSGKIECMTSEYLCDGVIDCADMSDETNCSRNNNKT